MTRNVTFNESIFYDPRVESEQELLIEELNAQVDALQIDDELDKEVDLILTFNEELAETGPNTLVSSGVEAQPSTQNKETELQPDLGLYTPRMTPEEPVGNEFPDVTKLTITTSPAPLSAQSPRITKTVLFKDKQPLETEQGNPVEEAP
ncbi:hypothetical protein MAJ_07845, partial [Metarhizium majus ARSEF 297]